MNSQIFVHAHLDVPNEGTNSSQQTAATNEKKTANRPSVAAVIRPIRHADATQGSVRLDGGESKPVPNPHVRSHQLEDYIQWLKDREVVAQAAKAAEHLKQILNPTAKPTQVADRKSSGITKSAGATSTGPEQKKQMVNRAEPARGFSLERLTRVDGAHHSVSAPTISPLQFQVESDLQRIEAKLSSQEIVLPAQMENTPAIAQEPARFTAKKLAPLRSTSSHSSFDPDQIIRTVSQAIASVLTDQTHDQIEGKIRSQLDQHRHQEALAALPPRVAEQIRIDAADMGRILDSMSANVSATTLAPHFETPQSKQVEPTAEMPATTDQEIPTTVAAWDVEEFRWPTLTNHMIVSGSHAISQLANSVHSTLGTSSRRLAVTSSGRGEGTTSIAISLARWVAASGKKVLLVDADLASPGLSGQVGLAQNISWINAVGNSLDPAEVIIRSRKSSVCVMPMAPIVTRVTWPRFIYDQLGDLIDKVQSSFDLILFDVGPTSQLLAELSQPSLLVDAGLIVHNGSAGSNLLKTRERLQGFGISKHIVAQNSVRTNKVNVA